MTSARGGSWRTAARGSDRRCSRRSAMPAAVHRHLLADPCGVRRRAADRHLGRARAGHQSSGAMTRQGGQVGVTLAQTAPTLFGKARVTRGARAQHFLRSAERVRARGPFPGLCAAAPRVPRASPRRFLPAVLHAQPLRRCACRPAGLGVVVDPLRRQPAVHEAGGAVQRSAGAHSLSPDLQSLPHPACGAVVWKPTSNGWRTTSSTRWSVVAPATSRSCLRPRCP